MTTPLQLAPEDTVTLHELSIREDGPGTFCVGIAQTGEFISLPQEGVYIIRSLQDGRCIADVTDSFRDRFAEAPDIASFVRGLADVGFVHRIGGEEISAPPQRSRGVILLGGLTAHQCRWLLWPGVTVLSVVAWTALPLLLLLGRMPKAQDALVYPNMLILLTVFVPVAWILLCLHELAHSLVARALGCPAYTRFGNRLWNLVCETDLSSTYSLTRRRRLRPLLAGMTFDVIVLDACVGLELLNRGGRPPYVIGYMLYSTLAFQTGIFLRTDLYYVFTTVARMDNLVPGARTELRYRVRRLVGAHAVTPASTGRRRRVVHLYLLTCLIGIGLGAITVVNLIIPASRNVIDIAVMHLGQGPTDPQFWAGLFVVAFFVFVYSVLTWTFIRNRREVVRSRAGAGA